MIDQLNLVPEKNFKISNSAAVELDICNQVVSLALLKERTQWTSGFVVLNKIYLVAKCNEISLTLEGTYTLNF